MACKMIITVLAGVIPEKPIPEYTGSFSYDSEDYERDRERPPHKQKLGYLLSEADEYARMLPFPHELNWVRTEKTWL